MIPNIHPETGIHYGVIHNQHLAEYAYNEIQSNGTDLDYAEALENLHSELKHAVSSALEDYTDSFDADAIVSGIIDSIDFNIESTGDCTRYHYKDESVEFTLCSDGDIFVTWSEFYTLCAECSPCAPNAGYLQNPGNLKTYCLGADWFDEHNPMPYKVFSVESDAMVIE
jgi:hypothetical protein